jgi:hypothetical protein
LPRKRRAPPRVNRFAARLFDNFSLTTSGEHLPAHLSP